MKGSFAPLAAGVIAAGLALTGCTNRGNSNNVTSGPHGPASPAMSGDYGANADLGPPYGAPKHAEPDVQSIGGVVKMPGSSKKVAMASPNTRPIFPKPENHAAPEADHGE